MSTNKYKWHSRVICKSWWWWWRKWCLQPWVASRMLDNWRRGNAQRGEKAKSVRDCLPVMQIKIQIQRQLQKYKQIQIYTFTTERDDLGTVGFAWRIQNESSRASKNSEVFTKFYFPQKRKCKQVSEVQFVQHMSQQLCLPVQKEWQKCTGLVCHSFFGEVKWPILALLKLVRQDCLVKQGVLRKLRVHVNCVYFWGFRKYAQKYPNTNFRDYLVKH